MYILGSIIFLILFKAFGLDKAMNISAWIIGLIPVILAIIFFVFFIMPSQTWQG
jgi:Flp pilus assembly protein TadB